MIKKSAYSLAATLLLASAPTWATDPSDLYVNLTLSAIQQSIGDDQKVSPRQDSENNLFLSLRKDF